MHRVTLNDFIVALADTGLSKNQAASILDVSIRTINRWIVGERQPPGWAVEKLEAFTAKHKGGES